MISIKVLGADAGYQETKLGLELTHQIHKKDVMRMISDAQELYGTQFIIDSIGADKFLDKFHAPFNKLRDMIRNHNGHARSTLTEEYMDELAKAWRGTPEKWRYELVRDELPTMIREYCTSIAARDAVLGLLTAEYGPRLVDRSLEVHGFAPEMQDVLSAWLSDEDSNTAQRPTPGFLDALTAYLRDHDEWPEPTPAPEAAAALTPKAAYKLLVRNDMVQREYEAIGGTFSDYDDAEAAADTLVSDGHRDHVIVVQMLTEVYSKSVIEPYQSEDEQASSDLPE